MKKREQSAPEKQFAKDDHQKKHTPRHMSQSHTGESDVVDVFHLDTSCSVADDVVFKRVVMGASSVHVGLVGSLVVVESICKTCHGNAVGRSPTYEYNNLDVFHMSSFVSVFVGTRAKKHA